MLKLLLRKIVFYVLVLTTANGYAQVVSFRNPSLEPIGTGINSVPRWWTGCNGTPDVCPFAQVNYPASNGSGYAAIQDVPSAGVNERISHNFANGACLDSCTTYSFTVDLMWLDKNAQNVLPVLGNGQLQIWGGLSSCGRDELLWTSPLVTKVTWKTYSGTFKPARNYCYLTLAPVAQAERVYLGVDNFSDFTPIANTCGDPTVTVTGNSVCLGNCVDLTAKAQSGTPPYTYSWSNGLPPGPGPFNVCPTATTIYTVTVTDSAGKTSTDTASVVIVSPPIANAGADVKICQGKSGTLTGSGGGTYLWAPATGLSCTTCASPVASPGISTTYVLTVTNSSGCTSTDTVEVMVNPPPTVSAGPNLNICPGSQATLTPSGANTYTWTPDPTLSCTLCTNPVASPSSGSVTYYVTGTDINGCTGTSQVTVTVSNAMTVDVGPDVGICPGGSATLNVVSPGATIYSWLPATGLSCSNCPNPVANPATTTTYIVGATNGQCSGADTIIITVHTPPTANAGADQSLCPGATASLNASGGGTYSWLPDPSLSCLTCPNPIASPSVNTTYSVIVTDLATGCKDTDDVVVNVLPAATITADPSTSICIGTVITLTAGGGTYYVWDPDPSLSCTNCPNPQVSPSATTTYTVTGTDANGCTGKATLTVTVNTNLSVTTSGDKSICAGDTVNLSANSPGATSYSWSPTTGLSCFTCTTPVATPSSTTTYVVNTSNGLCNGTGQLTITVNPIPVADAGLDVSVCSGNSTTLSASGGNTYSWLPVTGLNNPSSANPVATPVATTLYFVTVSNGYCSAKDSVLVSVLPLPVINAGTGSTICNGTSVNLNASGGIQYVWSPVNGLSDPSIGNPMASPVVTTTYSVIGTDANGCTGRSSLVITVVQPPVANAGPNRNICEGQSTQLSGSGGVFYSWNPSNGLNNDQIPNPIASPSATTTYIVTVNTTSPCLPSVDSVTVSVHPAPTIIASGDTSIFAGTPVTLYASGGGVTYSWYPPADLSCTSCSSPVATPFQTTLYVVTTIDSFGCRNRDTVLINVDDVITLYLPNAFNPLSYDGNSIFKAYGVGIFEFEFYIFNRWGELIFEADDPSKGWDGTFKGQPVQQDVYVWLAKARSITGKSISRTGTVTIVQ